MQVVVASKTSVRQRPSAKGDEMYEVDKGEEMKVILTVEDGSWVRVVDGSGTKGWVETSALRVPSTATATASLAPVAPPSSAQVAATEDDSDSPSNSAALPADEVPSIAAESSPGDRKKFTLSLGADLAFMSRDQSFTTNAGVGNYSLSNAAPGFLVAADAALRLGKHFELEADVVYVQTVGDNTITMDLNGMSGSVGWSAQSVDARIGAGLRFGADGKIILSARAGLHMANTNVDASDTVKLPSEGVLGYTIGGALAMPRVTKKIGLYLSADAMLIGDFSQSEGIKDGDSSAILTYLIGAAGTFRLSRAVVATASYTLTYQGIGFGGADQRDPAAAGGTRIDTQHLFALGLKYQF
jgi:hypothetical protein